MARGSKVPAETEAEFRKHYLVLGNVAAASRKVDLHRNTGLELAKRANADPEFVRARAELYARAFSDGEQMLTSGIAKVHDQLLDDVTSNPGPDGLAKIAVENDLKSFSYRDPKPDQLRALSQAVDTLTRLRKAMSEAGGTSNDRPDTIEIIAREDEDDDGNDTVTP